MKDFDIDLNPEADSDLTEGTVVSYQNPCPGCGKGDWCFIVRAGFICGRIAEPPTGYQQRGTAKDGRPIYLKIGTPNLMKSRDLSSLVEKLFPIEWQPKTDSPQWESTGQKDSKNFEQVIEYLYPDPITGDPLGKVVRKQWSDRRPVYGSKGQTKQSKEIRPHHYAEPTAELKAAGGTGWWSDRGKGPKPWPLYRQDEIAGSTIVFVVGGEQSVEAGRRLGLTATCQQGGETSIKPIVGYLKLHKPDLVVLWPDDDPTGYLTSERLKNSCDRIGIKTVILDPVAIWPEMPPKGDIFNFVENSGLDIEEIRCAIESEVRRQVEIYERVQSEAQQAEKEQSSRRGFRENYELIEASLSQRLRWNSLLNRPEVDGVPFPVDLVRSKLIIDYGLDLSSSKDSLIEIVVSLAKKNPHDPVRNYLKACHQKYGQNLEILDKFASKVFGNEDAIAQIQIKKTLISAVARAFDPGCQVRTALVIVGAQNWGKSKFWKVLASPNWFCDDFYDPSDKDHLLKLHESWIIEWAELHGLNKREATRVKQFMTTATDRIRRPYGRESEPMKRPSIMVGTSNDDAFLTDSTGNTRWWVIKLGNQIKIDWVSQNRDKIWGAAVALYKSGEQWWLTDEEEALAETVRKEYEVHDPWHDEIAEFVSNHDVIALWQIWDFLKIEEPNRDIPRQNRIVNTLKRLGWERCPNSISHAGRRAKVWKKAFPKDEVLGVSEVPEEQGSYHTDIPGDTSTNTHKEGDGLGVPIPKSKHPNTPKDQAGVSSGVLLKTLEQKESQASNTLNTPNTPISETLEMIKDDLVF